MTADSMLEFIETKIRLNRLREAIIKGVWKRRTYKQIAVEYKYSEATVKSQAYLLWRDLSNVFGEKITKTNFRQVLIKLSQQSVKI